LTNNCTILVTGTAGFIGYYLAKELLAQGHSVVGVDNFNPYYSPALKQARNTALEQYPNFSSHRMELCDFDALSALFEEAHPDKVCNLAAQANVRYSLINPRAYQKSNLEGFFNILQLSKDLGVERLVYASSSSVYGNVTELPWSEEQRVDTPISLYAATKKANELMAHNYTHLYGLPTVGLRFFTVYGPMGRPDMAMWTFSDAIMNGRPIKVFNHGDMQRDMTYIDDIIQGVMKSLFSDGLEPYEIINLGNHRPENLLDIIAVLEDGLGRKAEKELLPMQPGDLKATYANIDLAREKLGYEPVTSIKEGIPRFTRWFLDNPELIRTVREHVST
jgi:UDP-glucuronate 4-epimerase